MTSANRRLNVYFWCYALLVVHARKEEEGFTRKYMHINIKRYADLYLYEWK